MKTKSSNTNSDEQDGCPDCGNRDVVPKSFAWDALTSLPPKTERELNELRSLRATVVDLLSYDHLKDRREINTMIPVPVDLLAALAHNPQIDEDGATSRFAFRLLTSS